MGHVEAKTGDVAAITRVADQLRLKMLGQVCNACTPRLFSPLLFSPLLFSPVLSSDTLPIRILMRLRRAGGERRRSGLQVSAARLLLRTAERHAKGEKRFQRHFLPTPHTPHALAYASRTERAQSAAAAVCAAAAVLAAVVLLVNLSAHLSGTADAQRACRRCACAYLSARRCAYLSAHLPT